MELLEIAGTKYKVLLPQRVLDWLASAPANMSGHAMGFLALFDLYAEAGTQKLTTEQFHLAGGDDIYRFRKGSLRVYCFKDGDDIVVLSHANTKFKQKTPKPDLSEADTFRNEYLAAKESGILVAKLLKKVVA